MQSNDGIEIRAIGYFSRKGRILRVNNPRANLALDIEDKRTGIPEGGSITYRVRPKFRPDKGVTATPQKYTEDPESNNANLTFIPAVLQFTSTNWKTFQTQTVTAAVDEDTTDELVPIVYALSGPDLPDSRTEIFGPLYSIIVDSTPTFQLLHNPAPVNEGSAIRLTVTADRALTGSRLVNLTLTDLQSSGFDANDVSGTLGPRDLYASFGAGSITGTVLIPIRADSQSEGTEKYRITLNDEAGYAVGVGTTADGIIHDGTANPVPSTATPGITITPHTLTIDEGESDTYTVILDAEPSASVTVMIISDSVSIDRELLTFTEVTWNIPQSVVVSTAKDENVNSHTANLTHRVISDDTDYAGLPIGNVRIMVTDTTPTLQLLHNPDPVTEGVPIRLDVTSDRALTGTISVNLTLADRASSGFRAGDIAGGLGPRNFDAVFENPPGTIGTVSIPTNEDENTRESTETYRITLNDTLGYALGSKTAVDGVLNDEPNGKFYDGSAPENFTFTAGPTSIYLRWTNPTDPARTGWRIFLQGEGGLESTVTYDVPANATAKTLSGLIYNHHYNISIIALGNRSTESSNYRSLYARTHASIIVADHTGRICEPSYDCLDLALGRPGLFQVKLDFRPIGNVKVTPLLQHYIRDIGISIEPAFAVFTPSNWNKFQTFTINSAVSHGHFRRKMYILRSGSGLIKPEGYGGDGYGVEIDYNSPPQVRRIDIQPVKLGTTVDITARATDEDGDSLSYLWRPKAGGTMPALPPGTVLNRAQLTFTPTEAGIYTMMVAANDGYGYGKFEEVVIIVWSTGWIWVDSTPSVEESAGNATVRIRTSEALGQPVTFHVNYDGTATGASILTDGDYDNDAVTSVTLGASETLKNIVIPINDDGFDEIDETVTVTISPSGNLPSGFTMRPATTTVTIRDDDSSPKFIEPMVDQTSYTYQVAYLVGSVWDPDGDAIRYRWSRKDGETMPRLPERTALNRNPLNFIPTMPGTYTMTLTVKDRYGNSATDDVVLTVVAAPRQLTGLNVTELDKSVKFSWDDPNDASIIRYEVRHTAGSFWSDWSTLATGANATSGTVSNLVNGTRYSFRIRSIGQSGIPIVQRSSNEIGVTAVPSAAAGRRLENPTHLSGLPEGSDRIYLTWTAPTDEDRTGWKVRYTTHGRHSDRWSSWIDIPGANTTSYSLAIDNTRTNNFKVQLAAKSETLASPAVAISLFHNGAHLMHFPGNSNVVLDEGDSTSYTSQLTSKPRTSTPLTYAYVSDNPDITFHPASLTFTATTWNQPQVVTMIAAKDSDLEDDRAVIGIRKLSGDYSLRDGGQHFRVNIIDVMEESRGEFAVTVSPSSLTIAEGGSGAYMLKLATEPSDDVTITVGGTSGDVTVDTASLTFTRDNYATAQTVTVSAGHDNDAETDPDVTLTHSASGGGYDSVSIDSVVVSVTEDDTRGVTVSEAALTVVEGGSGTYTLALATEPSDDVTITVGGTTDDVTVDTVSLTFTSENYGTTQTVTVSAQQDNDAETDPDVTLTHSASGGGYDSVSIDSVVVSVTEDDTKGVTASEAALTVAEGGSGTYTLALTTEPSDDVTVTVSGMTDDVTVDTVSLTFTPENYGTAQTVTVSAQQDNDGDTDPDVTLTHAASGGGYDSVSIDSVVVSVTEDDTKGVTASEAALTVAEGGSGTYTLALTTEPSDDVTVTVSGMTDDVTVDTASLTFTPENYGTAQTVTVSAQQDNDGDTDPDVTLTHAASGGGYDSVSIDSVVVSVTEDDTKGVTVSEAALTVAEGGSGIYTLALATEPSGDVTVTVGGTSGDVTVDTAALTFTRDNYATAQTVTVSAGQDNDAETDPDVTLTHSASGGGYDSVSIDSVVVSVTEDDTKGVTVSKATLTVVEGSRESYTVKLDTQPSANVTITVGVTSGDVTVDKASLTFTPQDYATAQTVTVSAGTDEDTTDDSATLTHDARGGGYRSVDIDDVRVTVTDTTPTLQLLTDPAAVTEGSNISLTVTADKAQTGNLSVSLTLADRDASGFDADDIPGTLGPRTFPVAFGNSASRTGTVTIPTTTDSTAEGAEMYRITLNDGPGYAPGLDRTADGTLNDPAPTGTVSVPSTLSAAEGADANAVVRVTTTAAFGEAVTLTVAYGGAATGASEPPDGDYENDAVTTVSFGAADLTKDITIPITDDDLDEDAETFTVTISGTLPSGFTLGNATTTVTINDDDESPVLADLTAQTVKVGQDVDITASATDGDGDTVTYAWTRKDGETIPALPRGTALNAARLTFTTAAVGTYTMTVTASDGNGNTDTGEVVITVGMAGTISAPSTLAVTEGTDANATVTITASEAFGETVALTVAYGGAATGAADPSDGDYENDAVTTVSFGAADLTKDITIPITDDDLDEDAETFTVTISGTLPSGFTLGNATTTVTINDDDESPVLAALTAQSVRVGQDLDITASATDGDGDTVTYAWTRKDGETIPALPGGTALNAARLTFTTAAVGTYTMTVTASDGNGNTDTEDVVIAVEAAPTVTVSTSTLTVAEGGSSSYTVKLDTAPSADVTVTVGGISGDVTVDKASLTFTPQNYSTAQTVMISADHDNDADTDPNVTLTHSASGGGYDSVSIDSVVVSVTEDDTRGVTISTAALTVAEGGSNIYTVKLDTQPSANVTVTVAGTSGDVTVDKASLTFTPQNYSTAQTVTVSAAPDADANTDPDVTLAHSASGGGYGSVSINSVVVSVTEKDTRGVTISTAALAVAEGSSNTYTVKLDAEPSGNVTVTVGGTSGDVTVDKASLTFTPQNYATAQTVSVSAGTDEDTTDDTATLTHGARGGGYRSVSIADVRVTVNDTTPTLQLLTDPADVTEGSNISLTVTADKAQTGNLSVSLTLADRDASGFAAADIQGSLGPRSFTANFGNTPSMTGTVTIPTNTDSDNEDTEKYRVTLNNAAGYAVGIDGTADGALHDGTKPAKPTGLSAERLTRDNVKLSWDNPRDSSITRWQFRLQTEGLSKGWVSVVPSSASTTSVLVVMNLINFSSSTPLSFQVRAVNSNGGGPASDTVIAPGWTTGVTISASTLTVAEGDSGSYTVKLRTRPSADVTVTVGGTSGEVTVTGSPLTFTRANYRIAQTVTVNAGADEDTTDDTATLTHTAKGGGYDSVSVDDVNVTVTDTTPTLQLLTDPADVAEGSNISLTVTSDKAQTGNLSVSLTLADRDASGFDADDIPGTLGPRTFTAAFGNSASRTGTVTIPTNADSTTEGADTYRITLNDGPGYAPGLDRTADGTLNDGAPTGTVSVPTALAVTEGTDNNAVVRVTTTAAFGEAVTLNVAYGGAATGAADPSDGDYENDAVTSVSFSPTDTTKDITIPITDDDLDEDAETFTVTISGTLPSGFTLGNATTTVTINDDDESPVLTALTAQTVKVGQVVDITASATDGDGDTVTYAWTRKDGETTPPLPGGTALNAARLTFTTAAVGTYTMTVTASDGNGNSDTEDVVITVGMAGTVSAPSTLSVTEGTDANATVTITASEAFGETVALTVAYGGTATGASDPSDGDYDNDAVTSVSFGAAELTKEITIPITDDDLDEGAETFTVTISGTLPSGFTLGNATTTVTITDDDESPVLGSLTAQSVRVGQDVDVTASATDGDGDTVTYAWTRKDGETTPPLPGGTALNAAHLTFTTTAVGTYTMTVTASDGNGNTDTEDVVITVEAAPSVTVSKSTLTVAEGSSGTYTVKLDTAPSADVTVTVGGTSGDVTVDNASLTFTSQNYSTSQTVTVSAGHDNDADTDPDVTLTHSASGGGYGSVTIDSVVVSVTEDDTKGVTVSKATLTVAEGGSGSYTVKLDTAPSADVTITVGGTSGDVTVDKASLTFTPQNYATAQTVTVSASQDNDADTDPDVTLTHSASGGGYGSVTIDSVVVSVTEDDTKGVTVSTATLTVAEGSSNTYAVKLDTEPSANVTVTVGGTSGDVTVDKASLTFTAQNYATTQTVTVSAGQDNDADTDPDVTLTHSASGGGYGSVSIDSVVVSVTEKDTKGVTVSKSTLTVAEGSSGTYTVKLDAQPSANVTVTVSGTSGDVTVDKASLTFTPRNYSTAQTVTVSAGQDNDANTDPDVTLTHAASGGGYGSVSINSVVVSVTEKDTKGVTVSKSTLTVAEGSSGTYTVKLDTQPSANVTVTVSGTSGDVTVDKASLTFTTQNYGTAQTVTVSAGHDNDADTDPNVTLTHSVSGGAYGSVTIDSVVVSVTEDDTKGITVSKPTLTVAEGGSGSYTVKLDTAPSANVRVTVGGVSGDVTVDKSLLTFTPQNYGTAQPVTVSAGADEDTTDDTATLTHRARGGGYRSVSIDDVRVTVADTTPTLQLLTDPADVTEGSNITLRVTSDKVVSGNLSVSLTLADRDASGFDASDIPGALGPRTFTAAFGNSASRTGTVTIPTSADSTVEGAETYRITLNDGPGYALGLDKTADGTLNDPAPTGTVSVPATLSVTEGTDGNAVVRVTSTAAFGEAVALTVAYGGAATGAADPANGDYDNNAVTSVSFNATDTTKDITIPITDDDLDEAAETFTVTISGTLPSGFTLGHATTTVTINDDDESPVLAALTAQSVKVGQVVDITASATDGDGDAITYSWTRKAGETAPALPDGTGLNAARLTFTAGAVGTYTMTVTASDGTNTDTGEVVISVGMASTVSAPSTLAVTEGTDASATVTVTASAAFGEAVTINVAYGGSATGASDPSNGDYDNDAVTSVDFSATDLTKDITIPITDDDLDEAAETFTVTISGTLPSGFTLGNATTTVTITDDDESPVLAALTAQSVKLGEVVDITASATDGDGDTITYAWTRKVGETTPALPDGTGLNAARLTFTAGAVGTYTMTVTASDGTNTDTEEVVITVGMASTVSVPSTLAVTEGTDASATVTVTASAALGEAVTINVAYGGNATGAADPSDGDYENDAVTSVGLSATDLTRDITIPITDDDLDEDAETFTVTISGTLPSGFSLGNATTTVTITDDDESPVLAVLADQTMKVGEVVDITASATDRDGDTITYAWTRKDGETTPALPDGTGLNTARLTFTTDAAGTYTMMVTASDGTNIDTGEVVISVGADEADRPATPRRFRAAAGDGQVVLTWRDPKDPGITGWQLRLRRVGSSWGDWTDIDGSDASTTTHTVTGLDNDAIYRFRIRARNDATHGRRSAVREATPTASASTVSLGIADVTAGEDGAFVFTVTATPAPSSEVGFGYTVTAESGDTATAGDDFIEVAAAVRATIGANATSTAITVAVIDDTLAESSETFTVTLLDPSEGVTLGDPTGTGTITDNDGSGVPPSVPAPVTGFTVTSGVGSATLSWNDPGDSTITVWQYRYRPVSQSAAAFARSAAGARSIRSENMAAQSVRAAAPAPRVADWTWIDIPGSGANTTSFLVSGLTPGRQYEFQVRARNAAGFTAESSIPMATATPRVAPDPTGGGEAPTSTSASASEIGVTLSASVLEIPEGGADRYTVRLDERPSGDVTIAVSSRSGAVSIEGTPLVFTAANWNRRQTVTVEALEDPDAAPDRATLIHRASGGGYDSVDIDTVEVRIADDDTAGVTVTPTELDLEEGASTSYNVALDTEPTREVTVTVTGAPDDITVAPSTLTFSTSNWNRPQTVTVTAEEDPDAVADTATLTHQAAGGEYDDTEAVTVAVSVTDNDTAGVTVTPTELVMDEGASASYTVVLDTEPTVAVTVAVAGAAEDITVMPSSLTFTAANWSDRRTVTVEAGEDDDAVADAATLTHQAAGGEYDDTELVTVAVRVTDNDTAGVTVTPTELTVDEGESAGYTVVLDSEPTAPVTVTPLSGNPRVAAVSEPLVFTADDWATPQRVTVTGVVDEESTENIAATVDHAVAGGDYEGVAVDPVEVTVRDTTLAKVLERANRMNQVLLPQVAATVASQSVRAVADRIEAVGSGQVANSFNVNDPMSASGDPNGVSHPVVRSRLGMGSESQLRAEAGELVAPMRDVLNGATFHLGIGKTGGEDPGGAGFPQRVGLWGRGDLVSLSGSDRGVSWNGELWSAHFGVDTRIGSNLLAGVAVSHAAGRFNATSDGATGAVEGLHKTGVTSAHPYLAWLSGGGSNLWVTGGYGTGNARVKERGRTGRSAGLTFATGSAGGLGALFTSPDSLGGTMRLAVKGEGSWAQLENAAENGLEHLAVRTVRGRVAIEGSLERPVGEGTVTPSVEIGVRYDRGDQLEGAGVEAGGSLAYQLPDRGLTVELRGRTLLTREQDRKEWGVGAVVRLDPGEDARGLFLTLTPAQGGVESGVSQMFDRYSLVGGDGFGSAFRSERRLEAEGGYGFGLGAGALVPYAGWTTAEMRRQVRLGTRFRLGHGFLVSLEGAQEENPFGPASRRLTLEGMMTWGSSPAGAPPNARCREPGNSSRESEGSGRAPSSGPPCPKASGIHPTRTPVRR